MARRTQLPDANTGDMEGLGEGKKWLGSQEKLTLRLPEKAEKELFLGGLERTEEETMMDRSRRQV